ncbi:MAG: undecaprenyl-phosphate galactose phosphotransferase WbaP [candidate division WOR-3 bacterium]
MILIIIYVIAYLLRTWVLSLFSYPVRQSLPFNIFISRFYLLTPYILVFIYEGLYSKRFEFWEETRRLWKSNVLATAVIMIILYITRSFVVSRAIILIAFLLNFIFLPIQRNFIKRLLHYLQLWHKNILIIGSQPIVEKLTYLFSKNPILGYKPIANLNNINQSSIAHLLNNHKVDSIIVNAEDFDQTQILELYEIAEGKIHNFFVIPALSQLQTAGVEIEQLESVLLMKFSYNLLKKESQIAKRIFDLAIASIALIISLPLILIISLLIKITSTGPIFFIQSRLGKGMKLFQCYKFRTMYLDADKRLTETLQKSVAQRTEWEKYFKITNDPRVTPLGKFLRRSSLDELPQLLNVIKGEMSLVGPRPYLPNEVKDIGKEIGIITKVKPGLTGLWQVSGRSQLTFAERLRLDEFYVKNWSIWTDIVILVKTIAVLFKAEGAY